MFFFLKILKIIKEKIFIFLLTILLVLNFLMASLCLNIKMEIDLDTFENRNNAIFFTKKVFINGREKTINKKEPVELPKKKEKEPDNIELEEKIREFVKKFCHNYFFYFFLLLGILIISLFIYLPCSLFSYYVRLKKYENITKVVNLKSFFIDICEIREFLAFFLLIIYNLSYLFNPLIMLSVYAFGFTNCFSPVNSKKIFLFIREIFLNFSFEMIIFTIYTFSSPIIIFSFKKTLIVFRKATQIRGKAFDENNIYNIHDPLKLGWGAFKKALNFSLKKFNE